MNISKTEYRHIYLSPKCEMHEIVTDSILCLSSTAAVWSIETPSEFDFEW